MGVTLPNLTREEELILCCARTQLSGEMRRRFLELVSGKMEWGRVAEIARLHRLRPLVFKHFKAEGKFELLPKEIGEEIQRHAGFTIGRNFAQTQELVRILKWFREAGVEAIPFKGPVMAMRTYENLGLREFYDLDFLLRREDLLKARRILLEKGFVSPLKNEAEWEDYIGAQLGCDLAGADGKTRVELHWSFIQKWLTFEVDLEGVWRRAVNWKVAGYATRIIARDDLLLYLCAHGAKHHWDRLFWIIDIAEMARVEKDLDWGGIMERARAQGNWRVLALGLFLAKDLLEAPLPGFVWDSVRREGAVEELARTVGGWLFSEGRRVVSGDWEETKFYWGVKERLADRVAYSKHMLKLTLRPSQSDREFLKLPGGLDFLYPMVRPIRWVAKKIGG